MGDYRWIFHEHMGFSRMLWDIMFFFFMKEWVVFFLIWGYGCGWTDVLEMMGVGEDKFGVFFLNELLSLFLRHEKERTKIIPSMELSYPTLGKGNSSSKNALVGDIY